MNKKFKALLSCLALTATIGAVSACEQIKGYLPELPFLEGLMGTSTESQEQSETESTATEENSSTQEEETPGVGKNEYTATFVADGVTVKTIIYKKGATSLIAPAVPEKAGYTGAWEAYELNGNITVNAVYTLIENTVTFMADGEVVATLTYSVEKNEITAPAVPEKAGYTGVWEEYELNGNVTVNAVYTMETYNVTFVADGVQVGETQNYTIENKEITVPEVPAKAGYTAAWEVYELTTGNVEIQAIYTAIEYTVTFFAEGKQVGEALTYTVENKEITVPAVPEKANYAGAWEAYELTTGNVEVNAVYTAIEYTVTFMADGQIVAEVPYTVEMEAIEEPTVPNKDGYGGKWAAYELKGGDVTVEAIYTVGVYTVTFKADGVTKFVREYTVENPEIAVPAVPAKAHYTGVWEEYELTSGDVIVNAIYTAIDYTVTFMNGEETVATLTYNLDNTNIEVPAVPEKAHYTAAWDKYELTGGDITVNAVYTAIAYDVEFVVGGNVIKTLTYTVENTTIEEPAVPEKAGYTGTWEAYELKGGNVYVEAQYEIIEYTVTFMADGEQVGETLTYTVENKNINVPAVPEKAHYTNGAWEAYELTTGDIIVNATYEAIEYTVTFMADGEVIGTATYTVENADLGEVAIPEKTGYTGSWGDIELTGGDITVELTYTANVYTVTYNANGGEASEYTQEVTYDAAYTLATATAPKGYQEFLGWADEKGNLIVSETWNIASDVTLTAVYSEGVVFESMTEVPSYMKAADTTEYLAITELNGNKVLQVKNKADSGSPALIVTLDFLAQFFADSNVEYVAFEAKSGETITNNFRRVTKRANGTFAADVYINDFAANGVPVSGIRNDAFKTFYFSRADYQSWIDNGVTEERLIASGGVVGGDSFYVDNIRPVTKAQWEREAYSFDSEGIRVNDAGRTLLFYTTKSVGDWGFNLQVNSGMVFENPGYTSEYVTHGARALMFTKTGGNFSINFNSAKTGYTDVVTKTGYWAVDIYTPVGAGARISTAQTGLSNSIIPGASLVEGGWTTVYVSGSVNSLTVGDDNGGTYYIDNMRSITAEEYAAAQNSFEFATVGLRTNKLDSETADSAAYVYNKGNDYSGTKFSLAIAEGNGANDVNSVSNARFDTEIVHDGQYSIAFDKGAGYMYLTHGGDAKTTFANGLTFWMYSTTAINGTTANNITNGVNGKLNGGEGMNIPANQWVQITITADEIGNGRFLIIQGSVEGTIYLDDFQPLN